MKATLRFSMALSEACQNIVEHAGTSGWVAVQAYTFRRRLGRRVVVIAVSDSGIGFRRSLESTHAKRFGERWGDGAALEAALIQGVSRFRDPGRGQGLAFIKRFLDQWKGKISIRSGTARLAIVPPWDEDVPLTEHLPFFPGAQVQIIIPAQEPDAAMIQTIRIGTPAARDGDDSLPQPGHPPHRRRGPQPDRAGARPLRLPHGIPGFLRRGAARPELRRRGGRQAAADRGAARSASSC